MAKLTKKPTDSGVVADPDLAQAVKNRQLLAADYEEILISQLTKERTRLGLKQGELAARIGRNRMTVQRAESPNTSPSLSTFLEMAVALNLKPQLLTQNEKVDNFIPVLSEDIAHRGADFNRTRFELEYRDRQREASLAKFWEAANASKKLGLSPILETLVPSHTQAQATAVATAIQWLGSSVGFDFLESALAGAGYKIVDVAKTLPTDKKLKK